MVSGFGEEYPLVDKQCPEQDLNLYDLAATRP